MKINYYLMNLLIVILGILFFLINAKQIVLIPGLFLISILMMILPTIFDLLIYQKLNFIQILSLVFMPIIILNYIFYIQMGVPVGFTDPHLHIKQYIDIFNCHGKILFENAQGISFNFVGLYILFRFLSKISGSDIIYLATVIPPFLNLLIIFTVFLIVSKLFGYKIGILSMIFYGWDNQVLVFGQEFRTQTFGVLILFIIFYMLFNKKETNIISKRIIFIILLGGLITTSFVVNFYAFIAFSVIILSILNFKGKAFKRVLITPSYFALFIIFSFSYLIYIGKGFNNILLVIYKLIIDIIKSQTSLSINLGQIIYNDFIKNVTYAFWFLFIIFYIFFLKEIFVKREYNSYYGVYFIMFSGLFAFSIVNNLIGPLSSGRIYTIVFLFMASIVSYGIFHLRDSLHISYKKPITLVILSFIICFILASVSKMPNYIIGNAAPIRSNSTIDNVTYWSKDNGQYFVSNFIPLFRTKSIIYPYIIIENYKYLSSCDNNKLINSNIKTHKFIDNSYLILQNKHNNNYYYGRNMFPSYNELDDYKYPLIYNNNDYIIWYVLKKPR